MKQFSGFPARMEFTPVPNIFFSSLLPQISDIAELRTTLHIFRSIYGKRGHLRFTTYQELAHSKSLMTSLKEEGKSPDEALRNALEMAVNRGTILHVVLDRDGVSEDVYLLNTESDRQIVDKIQNEELRIPGLKAKEQTTAIETEPQPNIFALYEENIGMLTPLIADELREAEKLYPEDWFKDAIKEAISQGIRKWSYISAILERWSTEGRGDGTSRRDSKKKTDPDKYIKGKYGHIVRR